MAKKKAAAGGMDRTERIAGTILFIVYLLVLPVLAERLFDLMEVLLDTRIAASLRNVLYYYTLFAAVVLLFHRYLAHTTARLMDNLNLAVKTLGMGLLLFYGANELLYRLSRALLDGRTNLNDTAIAAQVSAAPRMTALIVIFLAPFVEEVFFRGLVFGGLRAHSRAVGYAVSCALFALLHVWSAALSGWDIGYLVLAVQYLVPGAVFAWAYDRSGTLWTAIALHALVNALSLSVMAG